MKKLCASGHKISNADMKALEEYLIVTPKEWADSALKGMINKAVKTILRDWFEIYKSKKSGMVPNDMAIIIPGIIAMPEFTPYKAKSGDEVIVDRKEPKSIEIWENGFDIEDYEKDALDAYYEDPEDMLYYFMENKVNRRKKAFVKENQSRFFNDPSVVEFPSNEDDFINFVTSKPGYEKRKERENENA